MSNQGRVVQVNEYQPYKRKVIHHLENKKWIRRECHGCKLHNPECERGACNLNPYRWKDTAKIKKNMIHHEIKRLKSLIFFDF